MCFSTASAGMPALPLLHQPAQMAYNTKALRQAIVDTVIGSKTGS